MKKLFSFLIIILLFSSCQGVEIRNIESPNTSLPSAGEDIPPDIETEDKIRAITVKCGYEFDIQKFKNIGFNTVVLQTEGVRTDTEPYRTDFTALKNLKDAAVKVRASGMKFIIEVISGPGLSEDGSNSSIYDSKSELKYFNKMLGEITDRYKGTPGFTGISLNIQDPFMDEYRYYSIWSNIKTLFEEKYKDVNLILNLHPVSFIKEYENVPDGKSKNDIINTTLYFTQLSYPGNSTMFNKPIEIDKNILLSRLKKLKNSRGRIIVTVRIPWTKDANILLQDLFELNRMLGYDINLCFSNGNDIYDFSKSESILNIIKRHSQ